MFIFQNELLRIKTTTWAEDATALSAIRTTVFVLEQHVPLELEWDEDDAAAIHFLAYYDDQAVGCARLLPTKQIGRMAVLAEFRRFGIGNKILAYALLTAKMHGMTDVWLNAQLHALEFYQAHDFIAEGDIFDDAGIPHRLMKKQI